jgi:hypothetical protein
MKIVIAIVLAGILTGCVHNVSCPPGLGEPGELCVKVMVPTPVHPHPLIALTEGIIAIADMMENE